MNRIIPNFALFGLPYYLRATTALIKNDLAASRVKVRQKVISKVVCAWLVRQISKMCT